MPAVSLKQQLAALDSVRDEKTLRAALAAIVDALQAVATKLDNDATVTDTNYAATVAAIIID